jgi:hypothetical protein
VGGSSGRFLPAIGALIAGITLDGVIGIGAAVLAVAALLGNVALAMRARRRRAACSSSARDRGR